MSKPESAEPRWPEVGSEAIISGTVRDDTEGATRHTKFKPGMGVRVRVVEIVQAPWVGPKPRGAKR